MCFENKLQLIFRFSCIYQGVESVDWKCGSVELRLCCYRPKTWVNLSTSSARTRQASEVDPTLNRFLFRRNLLCHHCLALCKDRILISDQFDNNMIH